MNKEGINLVIQNIEEIFGITQDAKKIITDKLETYTEDQLNEIIQCIIHYKQSEKQNIDILNGKLRQIEMTFNENVEQIKETNKIDDLFL